VSPASTAGDAHKAWRRVVASIRAVPPLSDLPAPASAWTTRFDDDPRPARRARVANDTLSSSRRTTAAGARGNALHGPSPSRVPSFARPLTGRPPRGARRLVDVAPTVVDLVGLPPLPDAQGASLAAAARGTGDPPANRALYAEFSIPGRRFEAIRRDGLTVVRDRERVQAWDAVADPGELAPLAPPAAAHAQPLVAALDRWRRQRAARADARPARR
jgi:arylsulfatase A-like enzyme